MFVWALTLRVVMLWWNVFSIFTIRVNKELIWVIIMGGWVFYVVEEKIHVVEAIREYECFHWERFGVFPWQS